MNQFCITLVVMVVEYIVYKTGLAVFEYKFICVAENEKCSSLEQVHAELKHGYGI